MTTLEEEEATFYKKLKRLPFYSNNGAIYLDGEYVVDYYNSSRKECRWIDIASRFKNKSIFDLKTTFTYFNNSSIVKHVDRIIKNENFYDSNALTVAIFPNSLLDRDIVVNKIHSLNPNASILYSTKEIFEGMTNTTITVIGNPENCILFLNVDILLWEEKNNIIFTNSLMEEKNMFQINLTRQ